MLTFGPLEFLVACAWGCAMAMLALAVVHWRQQTTKQWRLRALQLEIVPQLPDSAARTGVHAWLAILGRFFGRRSQTSLDRLVRQVDGIGLTGRLVPAEILGSKLVLASVGLLIALAASPWSWRAGLLLGPALAGCGWAAPTVWLRYRRYVRRQQILRDLPTVIDLLALCLEAGMGLDRALGLICDRVRSPLSDELRRVLTDMSLGSSREDAFAHLTDRVRNDDVRLLSSSIIQSEQLGSSLVSTVKNQARVLRVARRRRAETEALKAPIKMLFPMVLFILPTLFLVILGPAVLNMTRALSQGHP